ncbi:hypothetical protein [Thalassorhabdomicrobium marinisediminis]|uniref:hypothetical protein n=1 Tax=Thalassorhabdomicrobium marinisediminis TaxID=2170577 RepID=UPI002491B75C|nr:hypothetical protein [Thalassorhabdomicrobium marinisediminis]
MKELKEVVVRHGATPDPRSWPVFDISAVWPDLMPRLREDEAFGHLLVKLADDLGWKDATAEDIWELELGLQHLSGGEGWLIDQGKRFVAWIEENLHDHLAAKRAVELMAVLKEVDGDDGEAYAEFMELEERYARIRPESPDFLRPAHYCHLVVGLAARAAKVFWGDDVDVKVFSGELHSTVLIMDQQVVFDWLYCEDAGWEHPVAFAMGETDWDADEEIIALEQEFSSIPLKIRKELVPQIAPSAGLAHPAIAQTGSWFVHDNRRQSAYRGALKHAVATASQL